MLFALAGLFYLMVFVSGIASLVFFIMVLMQMFKRDQSNLGIICIVLTLCSGVGPLIAFVYGWMKATEWNIKKTMTYWTAAVVLQLVFIALAVAAAIGGAATMDPNQFNLDPDGVNIEFDMNDAGSPFPEGFSMPDETTIPDGVTLPDGESLPAAPSTE